MEKPSIAINDWACERIRSMILDGKYLPGDKLNVREIAQELEISQTPVKESLNRLVSEGIAENIFHRGYVVKTLSLRDIREIFELRKMMELFAVKAAVENAGKYPEQLKIMRESMAEMKPDMEWSERSRLEQHFHEAMIIMSENKRLLDLYRRTWFVGMSFYMYTSRHLACTRNKAAFAEHARIVEGLEKGDIEQIEKEIINHFDQTFSSYLEMVQKETDGI